MSGDTPLVDDRPIDEMVRAIVAEVLVVPADSIRPGTALIRDLGAESIDFMDLVFRLEEALGRRIPFTRWQLFVEKQTAGRNPAETITPETVEAFARQEASP